MALKKAVRKLAGKKSVRKKAAKATPKSRKVRKAVSRSRPLKAAAKTIVRKAPKAVKIIKNAPILKGKAKITIKAPPEPKGPSPDEIVSLKKTTKILTDCHIRQMLIEIGGENALAIVRNFIGNQSDEDLAKKLKIKISDVRATLNKLHNEGLVNYNREKDNETGWYSYSWSLNHQRMERWATGLVSKTGSSTSGDGNDYYFCPACGAVSLTNFESAARMDFRCERCNRMLDFIDERGISELYEKKQ